VLGAMLIDSKVIDDMLGQLRPEVFYNSQHQIIFKGIHELFHESKQIDLLTVSNHLKENALLEQAGGPAYIIELTNKVSSSAHTDYHAKILLQKYTAREFIRVGSEIIDKSFDDTTDIFELIDQTYTQIEQVSELTVKSEESLLAELIDPQIQKAVKIGKGEIKPGIPTPFEKFNANVGGFRKSEFIILAARPAMGKTAFAMKLGTHAARLGYPSALFNLEMSKDQIAARIISSESKTPGSKFNLTGLTEEEAHRVAKESESLKKLPFIIDDTPRITIEDLKIKAKQLKSSHNIQLIIIDYLQLMGSKGRSGNREQEISKISRGLKLIAKELDIPIIALSQLNRSIESQGGHKRPGLSHLRESGALEQDADMVMFLYRPEYYDILHWGEDYLDANTQGQAEYIVAKNRNGGLIRSRVRFEKEYALFSDLDDFNGSNQFPVSQDDFPFSIGPENDYLD